MSSMQVENGFFDRHVLNSINSVVLSEQESEVAPIEDESAVEKHMNELLKYQNQNDELNQDIMRSNKESVGKASSSLQKNLSFDLVQA